MLLITAIQSFEGRWTIGNLRGQTRLPASRESRRPHRAPKAHLAAAVLRRARRRVLDHLRGRTSAAATAIQPARQPTTRQRNRTGADASPRLASSSGTSPSGIESQKPRKAWGEKNLVHITPGKNGQEHLISSRSSLLSTISAREMKKAYEYETLY